MKNIKKLLIFILAIVVVFSTCDIGVVKIPFDKQKKL